MSSSIPLPRSPAGHGERVALPGPPPGPDRLLWLVRRIADQDHAAFVDLYQAMSARLQQELRSTTSDLAHAAAIASATFLEVWSLARFHASEGTDVQAWITDIAARRIADRASGAGAPSAGDPVQPNGPGRRPWWVTIIDNHDRGTDLALASLLSRPYGFYPYPHAR